MRNPFLSLCLLLLILAVSCSPKTLNTASVGDDYQEDLSLYRPNYYNTETIEKQEPDQTSDADVLVENDNTAQIDTLLQILATQNQSLDYIQGFTVQVYSGPSRESASKARIDVFKVLMGFEPEVRYVQPNFKVKVGKFTDRLEAQWVYAQLKPEFPQAIIIPQRIRLTD